MAEPVQFGQFVVVLQAEVGEATADAAEVQRLLLLQPLPDHCLHLAELPRDAVLLLAEDVPLHLFLQALYLLPDHCLQLGEAHFVGLLDGSAGGFVVGDVVFQDGLLAHWAVAEDDGDFLRRRGAVGGAVGWAVEADQQVGTAGTLDEEVVLDVGAGQLPVVLSGEGLEEDALFGAVADLAVESGPAHEGLADSALSGLREVGGDNILAVLPVLVLESLQFEFGAAGLLPFFRPEGAFGLFCGFVGGAGFGGHGLVGETQFSLDGVFDVVVLVDLADVGLEQAVVEAGFEGGFGKGGEVFWQLGHALEGVAFGGVEADLVVLFLEEVVDPWAQRFLRLTHLLLRHRQSQMGNEPNCTNFCCEAKAGDKPAEDVVLSEFILACQICLADVKHPKFKDHLDLVHYSEIEEVEGNIYVKCILCGKRADSLEKHGDHIKWKHPYAVVVAEKKPEQSKESKEGDAKGKEPKDFAKVETVNGSTLVTCQVCGKQKESIEKHTKHFMKEHAALIGEVAPPKKDDKDKKDKKEKKEKAVVEEVGKQESMLNRAKKQTSFKLESDTDFKVIKSSEEGKILFAAVKSVPYEIEIITKEYRGADYDPDDVDAELGWFSVFKSPKKIRYFYIDVEPKEKSILCKAFLFKEK